jgi:drug/metabolite transporter (DMT)-like permease
MRAFVAPSVPCEARGLQASRFSSRRFVACLALSMALVGSYVALSKPLVAAIPVFLLAWMRFGIGGLAMLRWLRKPARTSRRSRPHAPAAVPRVLLGNFLFSICMLFGVSMTSAVSAGVIMASIPAVVAVLSWAFLRERIPGAIWPSACAVAGIGCWRGKPTAEMRSGALLGNLLVFGAVLCEASYAVIGKKLTGALGPKRITSLINLWGLLLMTPFGLWQAWGLRLRRAWGRAPGCCCCSIRWPPACGRLAVDDGAEATCPPRSAACSR